MMLAQSLAFAPAFTAALVAGHRIFQIIDRKPKIYSPGKPVKNTLAKQLNLFEGVRYRDIEFRYPTRRDVKVLNGLNLEVLKGQTVALVGHSGCGKSTCVQLLQRYYDTENGSIVSIIRIRNRNSNLSTREHRSHNKNSEHYFRVIWGQ